MTVHQAVTGPTFEDILATGHVLRWHTKPMARTQTLADHLGKVAQLADKLGCHLGERYDDAMALDTLRYALAHDLPETEHGDIPNPAKRWLDAHLGGPSYDAQIERCWWEARNEDAPLPPALAFDLVRLADILEAATQYWVYGLDQEVRSGLIFEALGRCRLLFPELLPVACEALAAAGVAEAVISEAAA